MQIRKQLRRQAVAIASLRGIDLSRQCCGRDLSREEMKYPCVSGYHGRHRRIRFKARSRDHGNATGQSKKGGQKKG